MRAAMEFESTKTGIESQIKRELERIGIHCRLFARVKDRASLENKIKRKDNYSKDGKKIQDIIGIRIVVYFVEDVELLWNLFESMFQKIGEAKDDISDDKFSPIRKNMICEIPEKWKIILKELKAASNDELLPLIDDTFEIQFRSVLSEGWHEIDHTLKYKCKDDWNDLLHERRMFNGIYATLETSDNTLKALFDDLAYKHYKANRIEAMIRTKFRLHIENKPLSDGLKEIFSNDSKLFKSLYRIERNSIIKRISESKLHIPITFDNIIYTINELELKDVRIINIMPENIKIDIHSSFSDLN